MNATSAEKLDFKRFNQKDITYIKDNFSLDEIIKLLYQKD